MIIVFVKRCAPAQIHHAQLQMWLAPPMGALEMAAPAEQVHRSTSEWMDTTHLTMLAQCELIFRLLLKMTVGKGQSGTDNFWRACAQPFCCLVRLCGTATTSPHKV